MGETRLSMEPSKCSSCGEPFDDKVHKLSFTHPTLFGGIDYLCKSCVTKMDKKDKEKERSYHAKRN